MTRDPNNFTLSVPEERLLQTQYLLTFYSFVPSTKEVARSLGPEGYLHLVFRLFPQGAPKRFPPTPTENFRLTPYPSRRHRVLSHVRFRDSFLWCSG